MYLNSKTCLKRLIKKKTKIGFQNQLSLNAGQREHSAILLTCIKLPFVFKIYVLSIFEWPLKTGFTVFVNLLPTGGGVSLQYVPLDTKASIKYALEVIKFKKSLLLILFGI